jgi:hypothetical protein
MIVFRELPCLLMPMGVITKRTVNKNHRLTAIRLNIVQLYPIP